MQIACTKKLIDKVGIMPVSPTNTPSFFRWYANVINISRRTGVFFVNELTRYTLLVYGVKGKDWKSLPELLTRSISETLVAEGIPRRSNGALFRRGKRSALHENE